LQTFRQDLRPSFKVGPQASLFGAHLIARNYKGDQRDSYGEDWNQAKAKLHNRSLKRLWKTRGE
jgi:hypothetical protein